MGSRFVGMSPPNRTISVRIWCETLNLHALNAKSLNLGASSKFPCSGCAEPPHLAVESPAERDEGEETLTEQLASYKALAENKMNLLTGKQTPRTDWQQTYWPEDFSPAAVPRSRGSV